MALLSTSDNPFDCIDERNNTHDLLEQKKEDYLILLSFQFEYIS